MAQIQTVNVIEYSDDALIGVTAFPDDESGNKEAEAHFKKCATENGAVEEDIESFIEDGYYETGLYQLFLVHSE